MALDWLHSQKIYNNVARKELAYHPQEFTQGTTGDPPLTLFYVKELNGQGCSWDVSRELHELVISCGRRPIFLWDC